MTTLPRVGDIRTEVGILYHLTSKKVRFSPASYPTGGLPPTSSIIYYVYIYDYLHRQWSLSQRSSAASAPGSQWRPGLWGVGETGSRLRQNMCCSCSSQLVESLLYNYSHFDTVDGCEILHQLIDGWSMFIPLPIEFQPSLIDRCKISSIHLHPQYHID